MILAEFKRGAGSNHTLAQSKVILFISYISGNTASYFGSLYFDIITFYQNRSINKRIQNTNGNICICLITVIDNQNLVTTKIRPTWSSLTAILAKKI